MAVIGFDFGTTNSLISIIQGNKPVNLLDDRGLPFPSVVCYEGGKKIIGQEAKEKLSHAGLGVHGNIVRSPKMLLGKESVDIEGVARNPVDIVADVVSFVKGKVSDNRTIGGLAIDKAVVTIPVNFNGLQRRALRDAFGAAGIGIVQFIHEPLAALYAYLRSKEDYETALRVYNKKLFLVFDWGGGTLDLTLCRLVDGKLLQIANDGTDEVGGDVFDDLIKNEVEKNARQQLGFGADILPNQGAGKRLRANCERAKIELSDTNRNSVLIYSQNYFNEVETGKSDINYTLSRDELQRISHSVLNIGIDRINALLEKTGYSPQQIELCLATGGIVNMPSIKSRLNEIFGPAKVHVSEHSASLIAEGAAWVAHDKANLHLAKNIEILLARNDYITIFRAETKMPRLHEEERNPERIDLYCADPSDGVAKFSICCPLRPGRDIHAMDRRTTLTNFEVKVDAKAAPLRERLELEVSLDHDLILSVAARSSNLRDSGSTQIHNLEFGLTIPHQRATEKDAPSPNAGNDDVVRFQRGDVVLRSNISQGAKADAPGEVLYKFDSGAFDTRGDATELQREEKLYYSPCAKCGRRANDPLCRCAAA